uniref:Uncharacterized protein n=1 Tax=Zea mays TaxID=4577 RepID=A0A804M2F2_MAIZE
MEPLEVAITIIFDALLLVFMVKLFFAMFQMKLVVILFYLREKLVSLELRSPASHASIFHKGLQLLLESRHVASMIREKVPEVPKWS